MADPMVVRPAVAGPWAWRSAADGADATAWGSPEEAAGAAGGRPVRLLIPGTEVLLTTADVPTRQRGRAAAAVPWTLEDRLVDDVERLHFALGARTEDGTWPVAVIARAWLDGLLEQCAAAGLDAAVLLPEPLALAPPEAGAWTVLEEADRITVRTGPVAGFACEPAMLPAVLANLELPVGMTRLRVASAPEAPWPDAFTACVESAECRECADALAAFTAPGAAAIDLRQGPYGRAGASRLLRPWALPAGLAATLAGVLLLQAGMEYNALVEREQGLRQELESIYREAFPDAQRVVDPRAQMEGQLRVLRGVGAEGGDFVSTLGRLAPAVRDRGDVRITSLEWRQGVLDVTLGADRLEQIDALQQEWAAVGLAAELRGVEREGNGVDAHLRLNGAP